MGYTDGKLIGTILVNVDGITIWFDDETKLLYLDGSFNGSYDGKL